MNSTRHIEQDDLALFAMQLLSAAEAAEIARHVEHCPDCKQELGALQGDLALYAHTVDLHSPSPQARERLLKQVSREKKIVSIARLPATDVSPRSGSSSGSDRDSLHEHGEQQPRSVVGRLLPWAGWAIAAGLAVTAGNLYRERNGLRSAVTSDAGQLARLTADEAAARQLLDTMNDTTAMRVTLQKPQTAPVPQARATYVANKGALIFTASNMEPLLQSKVYELWLIPADGRDPIAAGTFHPDARGNASLIMPKLPAGIEAKAFGVTVEEEGGATTPTLPIIMVGT